jgi:hypothetical protein
MTGLQDGTLWGPLCSPIQFALASRFHSTSFGAVVLDRLPADWHLARFASTFARREAMTLRSPPTAVLR